METSCTQEGVAGSPYSAHEFYNPLEGQCVKETGLPLRVSLSFLEGMQRVRGIDTNEPNN